MLGNRFHLGEMGPTDCLVNSSVRLLWHSHEFFGAVALEVKRQSRGDFFLAGTANGGVKIAFLRQVLESFLDKPDRPQESFSAKQNAFHMSTGKNIKKTAVYGIQDLLAEMIFASSFLLLVFNLKPQETSHLDVCCSIDEQITNVNFEHPTNSPQSIQRISLLEFVRQKAKFLNKWVVIARMYSNATTPVRRAILQSKYLAVQSTNVLQNLHPSKLLTTRAKIKLSWAITLFLLSAPFI